MRQHRRLIWHRPESVAFDQLDRQYHAGLLQGVCLPRQGSHHIRNSAQVPLGMAVGTYVAALLAQVPVAVVVSANVGWCFGC